jgi:hypothetical protein
MKTFKNIRFTKRDYEGTNIVFCKSFTAPNENWIQCNESEILKMKCSRLHTCNDVTYYGYL